MGTKDHVKAAAEAHTNLTIFGAVIAILEGGCIYSNAANEAALKIIRSCKRASQQQLRIYDAERKKAAQ